MARPCESRSRAAGASSRAEAEGAGLGMGSEMGVGEAITASGDSLWMRQPGRWPGYLFCCDPFWFQYSNFSLPVLLWRGLNSGPLKEGFSRPPLLERIVVSGRSRKAAFTSRVSCHAESRYDPAMAGRTDRSGLPDRVRPADGAGTGVPFGAEPEEVVDAQPRGTHGRHLCRVSGPVRVRRGNRAEHVPLS